MSFKSVCDKNFESVIKVECLVNAEKSSESTFALEKNLWKSDHLNTGRIIPQYNFHLTNPVLEEFSILYDVSHPV